MSRIFGNGFPADRTRLRALRCAAASNDLGWLEHVSSVRGAASLANTRRTRQPCPPSDRPPAPHFERRHRARVAALDGELTQYVHAPTGARALPSRRATGRQRLPDGLPHPGPGFERSHPHPRAHGAVRQRALSMPACVLRDAGPHAEHDHERRDHRGPHHLPLRHPEPFRLREPAFGLRGRRLLSAPRPARLRAGRMSRRDRCGERGRERAGAARRGAERDARG